MGLLSYRDARGVTTDLDDNNIRLIDLLGAGAPPILHQTVVTPTRDGETYVRTLLQPRFLIAEWDLAGDGGFAATQALRRQLLSVLNPKIGLGTLIWTPVATTYEIGAIVESGLGFDDRGDDMREFREYPTVSFRCPDPSWRRLPVNAPQLVVGGSGLSVPVSVPVSLEDGTATSAIVNAGDLDSYPVITADGPFSGLTITNITTGKLVSFPSLVVAAGETLTIDMDARTARVGSTNVMPYRSANSTAWPLAVGAQTVRAEVSTGSTTVTLTYYDRLLGV